MTWSFAFPSCLLVGKGRSKRAANSKPALIVWHNSIILPIRRMDLHPLPTNLRITRARGMGHRVDYSLPWLIMREKVISSLGSPDTRFRGPLKRHKLVVIWSGRRKRQICPSFFLSVLKKLCLPDVLLLLPSGHVLHESPQTKGCFSSHPALRSMPSCAMITRGKMLPLWEITLPRAILWHIEQPVQRCFCSASDRSASSRLNWQPHYQVLNWMVY